MGLGRPLSCKSLLMSALAFRTACRYCRGRLRGKWNMMERAVPEALVEPQAVFRGLADQVDDRVDPDMSRGALAQDGQPAVDGMCPCASLEVLHFVVRIALPVFVTNSIAEDVVRSVMQESE